MPGADLVMGAVRRADHDRYLAALYAPEEHRTALFGLFAFDAEIAAVRDRIREPLPGEIRLQWWRDVIASPAGIKTGHPVADSLRQSIERYSLPRAAFENYLEARIFDLYDDPMPSVTDLEGYCGETAGAIVQLSALVLDANSAQNFAELAGHAGCAMAITNMLRNLPRHRARRQCFVPRDILAAAGTTPEEFLSDDSGSGVSHAVDAVMALARQHFAAFRAGAPELPSSLRPAYLPLAVAEARLWAMYAPEMIIRGTRDLAAWRKHWTLFRRAGKGWP